MASFPRALRDALDAYYSVRGNAPEIRTPITQRRGLTARLGALEKAYGGPKAAAAAVGIHPTTWTRWKGGQRAPSKASLAGVEGAYAALSRALKVKDRGTPLGFTVHAVVVFHGGSGAAQPKYVNARNSGPHRNIAPADSGYRPFRADSLTTTQRADVAAAYAAGASPQRVADVLLGAVQRQYGSPVTFEGSRVIVDIR